MRERTEQSQHIRVALVELLIERQSLEHLGARLPVRIHPAQAHGALVVLGRDQKVRILIGKHLSVLFAFIGIQPVSRKTEKEGHS